MNTFTGTASLVRFDLRRDRIKLPLWVIGISALAAYFVAALQLAYPAAEDLRGVAGFADNPAGVMMSGPGYGMDDPTLEAFVANQYGLYLLVAAAFMNVLLVVRHTRGEEENGRTELVLAGAVGRRAPLTAALATAVVANAALVVAGSAAMTAAGVDAGGAVLFAAGFAALGLFFAALTALVCQVCEHGRTATGLAAAALGTAFVVRGVGDVLERHGSAVSWLSPIAWSQQTRAFVDPRWGPLALSLGFAAAAAAAAYRVVDRGDLGAGLVPPRPGRAEAAPALANPFALALRQQRGSIAGWGAGLALMGLFYGSLTGSIAESFANLPEDILALMGGSAANLVDGFLGLTGYTTAFLASCFAILSVRRLRGEEQSGRIEPVLATATSRAGWMAAGLSVTALGVVALLALAGVGTGLGAAASTGEPTRVPASVWAHLGYAPAVLGIAAIGAALFGLAPRAFDLVWVLVVYGYLVGSFGPILDLPDSAGVLSPLNHVRQMPLEPFAAGSFVALVVLAALVTAAGLAAFRKRDVVST
ncbi:hypothetical protein QWW67_00990 [Rhodococcus sp. M8-50]|uniref:ABC transporter permease n=1 Tax=unclassified Rhodococcus (in: high G+C Gram-positive bacteria) TaxID=192944 RepID=UPI000926FE68|nr:hypothetical protein [Rhodococcus sp. M8]OLL17435.1 hypothetical protein BKE56_019390 [Rhodococcus sp. M8]